MKSIDAFLSFGLKKNLFKIKDFEEIKLKMFETLKVKPQDISLSVSMPYHQMLNDLLDLAYQNSCFNPNTIQERDAFEAKLFDILMPSPKEVKTTFSNLYNESPDLATKYLYDLSSDVNYIKKERLSKNLKWHYESKYGMIDLTINLAKPEKDPRDIAAAKNEKVKISTAIPKCVLCKENEQNYHNARMNLRIVPLTLGGEKWHFQYSPYLYYNEHAIILHDDHRPMKIFDKTFDYLLDFCDLFPNYFIGSNADLPIVGGSILNHDHFQAGRHKFPIDNAKPLATYQTEYPIEIEMLSWPLSTVRLRSLDRTLIKRFALKFLVAWQQYHNFNLNIYATSDHEMHNTITPILRMNNKTYELDIIFRNNKTTTEYPLGIFHPHSDLWHIKKENIGLIEAMGLAILPGRLKEELSIITNSINQNEPHLSNDLKHHEQWYQELKTKYRLVNFEDVLKEVGHKFECVIEDSGVFKQNKEGISAFDRFIQQTLEN
jgi:UDPglucose--hexose-1-phosphate uridylyltransferase